MKKLIVLLFAVGVFAASSNGSALAEWDSDKVKQEEKEAEQTISKFKAKDPSLKGFFDNAHGYAVFPDIGGGAFIVGFAEGEGLVYEKGEVIGKATLNQATAGLQAGGQNYSEIIFFKNKATLDSLKSNDFKLAKQASAVLVTAGASTRADYEEGVAVFTMPKGGLMLEASIGGQQFKFVPKPQ